MGRERMRSLHERLDTHYLFDPLETSRSCGPDNSYLIRKWSLWFFFFFFNIHLLEWSVWSWQALFKSKSHPCSCNMDFCVHLVADTLTSTWKGYHSFLVYWLRWWVVEALGLFPQHPLGSISFSSRGLKPSPRLVRETGSLCFPAAQHWESV